MVIDRPESADYLREGSTVALLFKETQVVLSKSGLDDCSLNNSFQSEIVEIEAGALFCRVKAKLLEFELSALITNKAYLALALEVGTSVIFHVRSNEIMLTSP